MNSNNEFYEIVVAGGGLAGTFAAVTAARMGKKVLLLDSGSCLGGTLTCCGVGPMMTGHSRDRQVIGGLFEELTERLKRNGYSCGHVRDTTGYISYLTPFSAEGMKLVLDEMTEEAGCETFFHVSVVGAEKCQGKISRVLVSGPEGLFWVNADIFIDATGDGDLAYYAGAPMKKGRESDGKSQPMTMNAKYCNVDRDQLLDYILKNIEKFPRLYGKEQLLRESGHLSIAGFSEEMKMAREKGILHFKREELLMFETDRKGEFIINTTRITELDGTTVRGLSQAERVGRIQCNELDYFLKKYVPGFKDAVLEYTGPSVGIRGSRQLEGIYTLTAEDIIKGTQFETRIALAAYPIDVHNPDGQGTKSIFKMGEQGYYSIPYEVMICREISNLLVTGRCISASFEAQAAIRTTPTTSALGQAAGMAAAMVLQDSEKVKDVNGIDRKELQYKLKTRGVIL
ncbi:MAG TPA: FAD-dependent oxidoreductase [Candidatus Lachnoclostridium avicola]|nr:FAD-dependent oxidoreductase [Candidatus Lachnoclostridium avicola]